MPPVHGWLIRILDKTSSSTTWLIRVGKVPTLLVLTWCVSSQLSTFLVLSLIIALVMLVWVTQLKPLMIFSSRVNILWGILGCTGSLLLGWIFLLAYSSYLWLFFELWSQAGLIRWVSLLGLTGLPPRVFFFMKALLILWVGGGGSFVLLLLFIIRTIILFSAYLQWMDDSMPHAFNIFSSDSTVLAGTLQVAVSRLFLLVVWAC